jgi:hypothetical protein
MILNVWFIIQLEPAPILFLAGLYEGGISEIESNVASVIGKISGLHAIIIPEALYDLVLSAEEGYHLDFWLSQMTNITIVTAYPLLIVQNDGYSYNAREKTFYTEELHRKYKFINEEKN